MTLLTVAPSFLFLSSGGPASKLIQSCSIPCRPPRSRTSYARRGRCSLGGSVCRERGLHPLNLPVRAARFLRRRRRSPTHRRRCRAAPPPLPTTKKSSASLSRSPLPPSLLRLSVSRSFLRGNWMTQKASQVSAARRCGDATRRAGRQISCSPPNGRDSPTGPRCARSNCRAECELDCENESESTRP